MNQTIYNISMGVGLGACASGAAMQWGAPIGLMVGGALVILLTLVGLKVGA